MHRRVAALATAGLLMMSVPAATQVAPGEQSALDLAFARGKLLYAYDQAAWHGTDDMLAKVKQPEQVIGGWIVDGPADAPELIFHDKDKAEPHAVYIARFRGTKLVEAKALKPGDDRTLSPQRRAMIAARDKGMAAWMASKPRTCGTKLNTVVLPPERPGEPALLYVLTPIAKPEIYPFGGHYRMEVSADGTVSGIRTFTNTCLEIPKPSADQAKRGALMFVSHLLDPLPTEIHVFTALEARAAVRRHPGQTHVVDLRQGHQGRSPAQGLIAVHSGVRLR